MLFGAGDPNTDFFATEIPCMNFIPHPDSLYGFCLVQGIPTRIFVCNMDSLQGFCLAQGIPTRNFVCHLESLQGLCLAQVIPTQNCFCHLESLQGFCLAQGIPTLILLGTGIPCAEQSFPVWKIVVFFISFIFHISHSSH